MTSLNVKSLQLLLQAKIYQDDFNPVRSSCVLYFLNWKQVLLAMLTSLAKKSSLTLIQQYISKIAHEQKQSDVMWFKPIFSIAKSYPKRHCKASLGESQSNTKNMNMFWMHTVMYECSRVRTNYGIFLVFCAIPLEISK